MAPFKNYKNRHYFNPPRSKNWGKSFLKAFVGIFPKPNLADIEAMAPRFWWVKDGTFKNIKIQDYF
ncbi:MAG: hypothetical protein H0A76_00175 [Candidatus Thiodubiliella endoseptemdiera]|uniref:Uncharacterized protein n=1 Tax=Candidatus Thiodubiliella endoseptemdiera TaxID=2738886 RepID=A0A853EXW5_9GAMM|nr:hypothetical protein [Candidatus Thiodubiliella endoseptemdiera]